MEICRNDIIFILTLVSNTINLIMNIFGSVTECLYLSLIFLSKCFYNFEFILQIQITLMETITDKSTNNYK